jgi:hypothetical protein
VFADHPLYRLVRALLLQLHRDPEILFVLRGHQAAIVAARFMVAVGPYPDVLVTASLDKTVAVRPATSPTR